VDCARSGAWLADLAQFGKVGTMNNLSEYVTSILAVLVVLGVFVMLGMSIPIPVELWTAFGVILGFFFGNTTPAAVTRYLAK
jgi:hypothetical protein